MLAQLCEYDNPMKCTAHGKRKSTASEIINSKENIGNKACCLVTRHKSATTNMRYTHPDQRSHDKVIRAIQPATKKTKDLAPNVSHSSLSSSSIEDSKPASQPIRRSFELDVNHRHPSDDDSKPHEPDVDHRHPLMERGPPFAGLEPARHRGDHHRSPEYRSRHEFRREYSRSPPRDYYSMHREPVQRPPSLYRESPEYYSQRGPPAHPPRSHNRYDNFRAHHPRDSPERRPRHLDYSSNEYYTEPTRYHPSRRSSDYPSYRDNHDSQRSYSRRSY
jgi:hypothetical protein